MSSLQSYLAKNYLTASSTSNPSNSDLSTRPKKRRKKDSSQPSEGLIIADDDDGLSLSSAALSGSAAARQRAAALGGLGSSHIPGDSDDDTPELYDGRVKSAEFRKKKTSSTGWKAVPDAIPQPQHSQPTRDDDNDDDEDAAANDILAAAQAANDSRRRGIDEDDAPAIVEDDSSNNAPKMESGVRAGLQTAADTARLVEAEERARLAEEKALRKARKSKSSQPTAEENEANQTIYRDATGRRIDVSAKRAEARAAEIEKEKVRKREREEAMGDVQRRMRQERKEEVEEARFLTVARGVDDEEMNEELKRQRRWEDPMAGYLARQEVEDQAEGGGKGGGGSGKGKVTLGKGGKEKKKLYQGAAEPNRYGILPGWRWDGVDRGNGFEKEWFQARSRKSRNEEMGYQWQMDE